MKRFTVGTRTDRTRVLVFSAIAVIAILLTHATALGIPSPPSVSKAAILFDFPTSVAVSPSTLCPVIEELVMSTGKVIVGGGDSACPTTPFTFDWGDGQSEDAWFPVEHWYADPSSNYIALVTAHYPGGRTDTKQLVVQFQAPSVEAIALPTLLEVTIPDHTIHLATHALAAPKELSYFSDSFFPITSRSTLEYVLSVAAWIQYEFSNQDVALPDGTFRQVILRDSESSGAYSLWFTTPVSFGAGDFVFQGSVDYSTCFHEMGHNVTLNSPAEYYFGGKTDGWANAILSETLAQIYQHATGFEIVNNSSAYGLSADLAEAIKQSVLASYVSLQTEYREFCEGSMPFSSWNSPSTPEDETWGTFMSLAYTFLSQAAEAGQGYREPIQRMMKLLQTFDPSLKAQYLADRNTPQAEEFRATFMVAAISYGLEKDLRKHFRDLGFPISDATYDSLMSRVR